MSIMAGSLDEENSLKKDDFIDPLGAKDPLGFTGDDDHDGVEFDVSFTTRTRNFIRCFSVVKCAAVCRKIRP